MFKPNVTSIIDVLKKKSYQVYNTPSVDWNLNIVGIRSNPVKSKKFDDTLTVFHQFMGEWDIAYYPITTDPSPFYLEHPINSKGTAILKPGQYRGVYKIDTHKTKKSSHQALCQRLGDVTVYRDNNRNGKLNLVNEQTGRFGINIHKGPKFGNYNSDNLWYSAGCQVFADTRHFGEFMLKCKNGRDAFGNKFTYTLLEENDFK